MITHHPASPEKWSDLERLFGPRGACGGCWCMWWRLDRAAFEGGKGEPNRERLRALVVGGVEPGLLAYLDGEPIAWCAVAPRSDLSRLDRSRLFKPVDDVAVWSVTCFFVAVPFRRRGVSVGLLRAAAAFALARGAPAVEGYPVEPHAAMPGAFA